MLLFMLGIRNSSKRMTAVSYDFFIAEKRSSYFFYRQKQAIKSRYLARDHGFHLKFLLTLPANFFAPIAAYWSANKIAE